MDAIERSLALINSAQGYHVTKGQSSTYEVRDVDASLAACYSDGEWTYFVTDVYNSGHDYAEIDMDAPDRLAEFVRLLGGDA